MPKQIEPHILEILKKYHHDPKSAVWDCHGTWVVYHKDIELMAAKAGVKFDAPMVLEANGTSKCVALCVMGHMEGAPSTWSVGEASPANCKNAYPYAMAEKRARDRVALKLLGLHGLYSEEEAEAFKDQPAPDPQAGLKEAYISMSLAIIDEFGDSASDLREWWLDETVTRERFGILNGTVEYADLFTAFKDKGLSLASMSNIKHEEMA